jgi:hypothetical protein
LMRTLSTSIANGRSRPLLVSSTNPPLSSKRRCCFPKPQERSNASPRRAATPSLRRSSGFSSTARASSTQFSTNGRSERPARLSRK